MEIRTKLKDIMFQHNATHTEMVARLLDHLERNPSWKLHGFLRACALTGQQHVVTLLGLIPRDYEPTSDRPSHPETKTHYYHDEERGKTSKIPAQMLEGTQHFRKCLLYSSNYNLLSEVFMCTWDHHIVKTSLLI